MKLYCLMLSAALVAAPAFAREDPPPQDPNAAPAGQGQAGSEAAPQQSPDPSTPVPSQPPAPAVPMPVALGDFAIRLATGLGLQPPATGYTPESAAWILSLKGVKVRPDLSSPLTEADAVTILNALGYKIRTTTPSRVVTADKVELILAAFIPPGKS